MPKGTLAAASALAAPIELIEAPIPEHLLPALLAAASGAPQRAITSARSAKENAS